MTSEEKKAILLLKAIIFNYHGIDEDERAILDETATEMDASKELEWANDFVAQDYYSAFERGQQYLDPIMHQFDKAKRLEYLSRVWEANNLKGYISEMEATAMLKLAQDWQIENELISMIKG
jgi:uncharacterized tellurite resistance protein B-like protein